MKNHENSPAARSVSKLTTTLIWLNAAIWVIAASVRLANWFGFDLSGNSHPLTSAMILSISVLICIGGLSGGIMFVWLNAAILLFAGTLRLADWFGFIPPGSNLTVGFVVMSSFSVLTCIAGLLGGIMLIRMNRLAAYIVTAAYLGGIASYLAVWMKLPSTPLPYKAWIFGSASIIYIWTLHIRGTLR